MLSAEDFWTWANIYTTGYDGHPFLSRDKCVDFKREIWFELGKYMWRKNRSVYQDHMKYIRNDIVKPFKVKILRYANRVRDMNDLEKYPTPPSINGESAEASNWTVGNHEFTASKIRLAIKDRFPSSMNYELEDHPEYYHSLTY